MWVEPGDLGGSNGGDVGGNGHDAGTDHGLNGGSAKPDQPERVFLVVVDGSSEWQSALRLACRRAAQISGRLALLHIMEPLEFQHWIAVEEKMRQEVREEAEARLATIADEVHVLIGSHPVIHIRDGSPIDELMKLIDEDRSISTLVLAARGGSDGPGPLIHHVTGKGMARMRVPVTIVPALLSEADIDALA